ncbi:MAG: hypothetical protein PHV34_16965 [Verrucomicrobiae bacterium]|nr:hypothetical protein [Verrucomicrobiae bacterium]
MDIERFQAPTLQEAIEAVRQRWGPEAVILHVEKIVSRQGMFRNPRETIEVTAKRPQTAPSQPPSPAETFEKNGAQDIKNLREELDGFRSSMQQLERVQWARSQVENAPLKHPLLDFLVKNGLSSHHALELIAEWTSLNPSLDIPKCMADLDRRLRRLGWNNLFPSNTGRCTVLFGMPGCGKTLLLIKIAARLSLLKKDRVMLVSADMTRPGPSEELSLYSEILQIPLKHIFDLSELSKITAATDPQTQILVDYNGVSPYSPETWQSIPGIYRLHPHAQVLLAASLASDLRNWELVRESLSPLRLSGLALTQADLEHRFGKILEAARSTHLPLALISTGKNVPGDIFDGKSFPFAKHFFCGYNLAGASSPTQN